MSWSEAIRGSPPARSARQVSRIASGLPEITGLRERSLWPVANEIRIMTRGAKAFFYHAEIRISKKGLVYRRNRGNALRSSHGHEVDQH